LKFNLFREESEGYAKLVTELLTVEPTDDENSIFNRISQLIGQFNLDPNRTVDLLLDCFACNNHCHRVFIGVLKLFNVELETLKRIILLKFVMFKVTSNLN
jgi:THO complex subunit 2